MKVLVTTDGSSSAQNALEYTKKLARNHKSYEVTILTVACSDAALARGVVFNPTELASACSAFFKNHIDKAKEVFEAEGINVTTVIESGDPAGVILNYVKTQGIEKVVMGNRGLSKISGLLLGSVTSKVIAGVDVPVTLVK